MDPRLLDVLHNAADVEVVAVVERVDVDLHRIVEESIDEHGMLGVDLRCAHEIVAQHLLVVDDLHAASAEHVGRTHEDGVADLLRDAPGFLEGEGGAETRGRQGRAREQGAELRAILSEVDGSGRGADDGHACVLESLGQSERGLPAELDDDARELPACGLGVDDFEDVFECEWLEVETIGGVVVSGHGLGVAVDHDRLVADLAQGERRVDARVVELDALSNAIGPGAEDDHLAPVAGLDLGLLVVRRVVIRRARGELRSARIDGLEGRPDPPPVPQLAHFALGDTAQRCDLGVGEAVALGDAQQCRIERLGHSDAIGEVVDDLDLGEEPGVDTRGIVHLIDARARPKCLLDLAQAAVMGSADRAHEVGQVHVGGPGEDGFGPLEGTQGFLQGLGEIAPDRHRLAHGFHRGGESGISLRELLERETRHLDDDVVEGGLEGGGCLARDVVGDLVEGVAHGEACGDLGDGESGRLGREGG